MGEGVYNSSTKSPILGMPNHPDWFYTQINEQTREKGDSMINAHKTESGCVYQILVQGRLSKEWSSWLNGMSIRQESDDPPATLITGKIIDQAQLRGILNKIWDLNLNLISVKRID